MSTASATAAAVLPPEPLSMRAVLGYPAMRRLWYAQIVSVFGDFLALFAVIGILTFKLHGTPQQITGLQIAYLLPIAILGIMAGVFVDRWPLKITMVASDSIRAVLVLCLLFATQLWHFYVILAAISVVSSFFGPAQGVAIRSVVPIHGLRSANALMQQVMFGMRIVGPATAAFLVASFGAVSCYLIDAASFLGSALLIASVALAKVDALPAQPVEHSGLKRIGLDMQQGISFIVHHAALLFVILALGAGMFVLGCFGPLIAVYVRDSLHASTKVFGVTSAMIGLGMMVGINALNILAKNVKNTVLVYAGLSGIAAGLLLLTALTQIWSTILGNLIIGFAVAAIIIPAQTLIQQETPHALMGRVGSTVMSVIMSAQITGLILSGLLANHMGVRHVFAICAVLLVILTVAGRLFMEPKEQAVSA
ncbi:MFS transporter [Granulicella arctica]|uniref:MFS transporter n=1 Tax=Granulicella arctica TaxID=940613 RepID=UPI0021E0D4CF|nr:MFS transporter [Granulicella arctica]